MHNNVVESLSCSSSDFSSLEVPGKKKVRVLHFGNEFPPDDLHQLFRRLRLRSKHEDCLLLRQFLSRCAVVIRDEVRHLPAQLRSLFPPIGNVLDLISIPNWRRGPLSGAMEGVLLSLLEMGLFIGHFEHHSEEYDNMKTNMTLTGLGMGILNAAAIAVSATLAELPAAGAEVVRMALRMGLVVEEASQALEPREPGATPESWATVVMDMAEDTIRDELQKFNQSMHVPTPSQIFVSAVGDGSVTVSGPPSKLGQLFKISEKLRYARFAALPVYGGLCHAPHLYDHPHTTKILETVSSAVGHRAVNHATPLLSTNDGRVLEAATAKGLFELVVTELLTGTIRWDSVVESISGLNVPGSSVEYQIDTFRSPRVIKELASILRSRHTPCEVRLNDLLPWALAEVQDERPISTADCKIAVVGMACRFPGGANDPELFWDLLMDGRDVHTKVPADRYDVESHTDSTGQRRNTSLTPFGCFVDQPGLFDAGFFNMSPREAAQTDPMQRLALVTAYEALEQSGFVLDRTSATNTKRVSTFYGQACDDYREVNSGQEVDTYFITGGCRAFGPGRINYFFKFSGPSFDCDTACSSSLATIQIACTSLLMRDTDTVVAGGLNILTNSDGFAGLSRGHFLSKTGSCKTWDINADGYCRADGVGSIVMKRLEDAQADNDHILGVILSSATNHSADAISITHPHAPTQADLYRQVLDMAGVNPVDVDFVEMHGTGTQAGDTMEIESVTSVFAPASPKRQVPLHIGAVKANVGHGEAAAGIMAFIKALLVFQKGVIPRHVGIKTALNPKFPDLARLNVRVPEQEVPWPRQADRKRYIVVNNFSAAGGNTTVLMEEAPVRSEPEPDPRSDFVITVSAKSKFSLKHNLESLIAYLDGFPDESLPHLSYTLTARRIHHNHRIAVHGSSVRGIIKELEKHLTTAETQRPVSSTPPAVAYVFSGQGTFYAGVGRELFQTHAFFKTQILGLDEICRRHGFQSFLGAITADVPEGHVFKPIVTQLTIVCVGIALCRLWNALGVRPSVVIGASLGEYAAFYAAGVLSASDAIFLAGRRAMLLEERCSMNTHAMLAVRATVEEVRRDSDGKPFEVACLNGRSDVCVSGSLEQITDLRTSLEGHSHKCHQLNVPFAFHSTQMDSILDAFEKVAAGATFKPPSVPIISPLLDDCVFDGKTISASYMREATRKPVRFVNSLDKARQLGLIDDKTIWIDIGPHPICCNFIRSAMPDVAVTAATLHRDESNWQTLARSMTQLHTAGVEVDWHEWHAPFEPQLRLLPDLPAYKWNNKNYWLQYNGDWMLTKDQAVSPGWQEAACIPSTLRTSLVHRVIEEVIWDNGGKLVIESDLMQPDFYDAANGHRMNGCAVVTSSIHADVAFTIAKYLHDRINPHAITPGMDMRNLEVERGLIARKDRSKPQWIQVQAVADMVTGRVQFAWYNKTDDGIEEESFATAVIGFGNTQEWLEEWSHAAHLVTSRIDVLNQMANEGAANRLSRDMAYNLFANLVDYSEKYRGMQSVVLHGMEATANVVLSQDKGGSWTIAPHHIDSVAHLAGFICNGGNALDYRANFFVTPGWRSMRFARPLVSGGHYRSYVKMAKTAEAGFFAGDVYILQGDEVIGLVGGIKFRTFPRLLLANLFSAPDMKSAPSKTGVTEQSNAAAPSTLKSAATRPAARVSEHQPEAVRGGTVPVPSQVVPQTEDVTKPAPPAQTAAPADENSVVQSAMALIAAETAMEVTELTDNTEFAAIGVDSLLSLVLSEKFAAELKIEIRSTLFLECPTIKDLKTWLIEYC